MTVGNKVTAYKYNKNDELLRTDTLNTDTERDSVVLYKYDKNGNQLATVNRYEIPSDKKDSTYIDIDVTLGDNRLNENVVNHYNAENQLIQTLTKNYKVSFTYDAEGLRTSKTVNGKKTTFVWDGDQLVMELDASGKVEKRYIRGNDLIYADKGNGTEKQYYVTDPHGNVVQLTDEKGSVIKTYEYDSFGNEVNPDGKDDNPFRYCGEYYDKETEEVYLRARYYEPAVGRFLTRDTYTGEEDEPESLHLYAYCGYDGVNMVDPSGHWGRTDGKYVHKEITKEAYKKVNKRIQLQISLNSYTNILSGSIIPDCYKKKTIYWKNRVCGVSLKNDSMFHGKSTKKLKKLKNIGKRKLKKHLNRNEYIFLGCILHSIQDFYAHSYVMDLEKYKKNAIKYADNPKKYRKYNIYHSDWAPYDGVEGRNVSEHKRHKDNPWMDYRKVKQKQEKQSHWGWIEVNKWTENKRYILAVKKSRKYMNEVLKNVIAL